MRRIRNPYLELSIPALLAIACLACSFVSSAVAASRPNILFVLTDDVGWGDIRAYNSNGKVELPAIERLAREGIRFTDAHTSTAKCAPSRYSIISGNYQWRGRKNWGQWNYKGGSELLAGQDSLGDILQRAGYVTAIVGKYHLGAQFYEKGSTQFAGAGDPDDAVDFSRAMSDGPPQHGFDYSFIAMRGIQEGPYAFFENGLLYGNPAQLINWNAGDYGDTRILADGIGLPDWVTREVGPTLLAKSRGFISAHQQAQASTAEPKPFFLFVNTEGVHGPWKPPVSIGGRNILGTSAIGARGDMLVETDTIVERLLLDLEQRGLLQDTLVILTSDNGAVRSSAEQRAGHFANGDFRGDKGTIFEGGHRVPLIIKWGQQAFGTSPHPHGTVINALVGVQDLFATLAELVGVRLPADQGRDSVSLLPVLMGKATTARDQIVHEADAPEDNSSDDGIEGRHFAYRSGSWKLVFNGTQSPVGLYDLALDPYEKSNLVGQPQQADRVATMKLALEKALASERTAPVVDPSSTPPSPTVSLSASPTSVAAGTAADLTWSSTDATACTASDGWSGPRATNGSAATGALSATTSFTLTCTGEGGAKSSTITVTVTPPSSPTVTLSVTPANISAGEASTLAWTSSDATSCTASGGWVGQRPTSGSAPTGTLAVTTGFTLTCTGDGGTGSSTVMVTVTPPPVLPSPTVSLSASPASIVVGEGSTLAWSSSNATACTASGGWSGARATSGSAATGALSATTSFTLSCTGEGGTGSSTISVVATVSPSPSPSPSPAVSLSASPASVAAGETSTLVWSSSNATACTASGGWSDARATNGSEATGALAVTTGFTLTCTGGGGTASSSVTITASPPPLPPPTVSLSVSPASIATGEASTLAWSSSDATACTASGGWNGERATSGSATTGALSAATSFTLTCTGAGGTESKTVNVSVTSRTTSQESGGGGAVDLLGLLAMLGVCRYRFRS